MKKVIKLKESDLINIIKRVISEASPVEKAKSPCPGMKVCWASANVPAGCCPVGYTCDGNQCVRIGDYEDLKVTTSVTSMKEEISGGKGKRKCKCKPNETMVKEFPCECAVPMTPPQK